MIKKILWLVIAVLITACSVFIKDGGLSVTQSTPTVTATECLSCTIAPTSIVTIETPVDVTATTETGGDETSTDIPTEVVTPTFTATATDLPTDLPTATATVIPSQTPTATTTQKPTSAATATKTSTAVPATATATATRTPSATPVPPTATATFTATATTAPMTFAVQATTPVFMVNFVHTSAGCKWQGVAGQVFDKNGTPLTSYIVKITGTYNNAAVSLVGVTGMVSGTPYGPGSYEIVLGKTPIASIDLLSIQVFDSTGKTLTDPLKFSTSSDCSKNLVIINFKQS